jgi:uncharacterized membrane-anchored protein YhcB (DUF1043 family)
MWWAWARKDVILPIGIVVLWLVLRLVWRKSWKWLEQEFEDVHTDIVRERGQMVSHITLQSF